MGGCDLNQGWLMISIRFILYLGSDLSNLVTKSLAVAENPFGHLTLK
jgi:hypothetical protein